MTMLICFEGHEVRWNGKEMEITLFLNPIDSEFAKEISKKHPSESRDMTERILDYITENLPEIRNAMVKVMSGSILVCSVSLFHLQNAVAEEAISQAAIEKAMAQSPEIQVWIDEKKEIFEQNPLLIEDKVYLPIRELCEKLKVKLHWNQEKQEISIHGRNRILQFCIGEEKAKKNGEEIRMSPAVLADGKTFVPLRFIGEGLGYFVQWEAETKSVFLTQNQLVTKEKEVTQEEQAVPLSSVSYQEEDLYWLSRLVHAEAQGENYEGKLAVANVILNRVKSKDFPNSVKEVIFDTKNGVQFIPVINGMLYQTPGEESIRAARAALAGQDNSMGTLYFVNPDKATNLWIMKNRRWAFAIEEHHFYY